MYTFYNIKQQLHIDDNLQIQEKSDPLPIHTIIVCSSRFGCWVDTEIEQGKEGGASTHFAAEVHCSIGLANHHTGAARIQHSYVAGVGEVGMDNLKQVPDMEAAVVVSIHKVEEPGHRRVSLGAEVAGR